MQKNPPIIRCCEVYVFCTYDHVLSENAKNFAFYEHLASIFCTWLNMGILGKTSSVSIFMVLRKSRPNYCWHFYLRKDFYVLKRFLMLFRNFETRRNFYGSIFGEPTHKKSQKNQFFQNTLKCDLNEFWYRFWVQNCSKTSRGPISGHITWFWTI